MTEWSRKRAFLVCIKSGVQIPSLPNLKQYCKRLATDSQASSCCAALALCRGMEMNPTNSLHDST